MTGEGEGGVFLKAKRMKRVNPLGNCLLISYIDENS